MESEVEIVPVEILSVDGKSIAGEFSLWDESPNNSELVQIELRFDGVIFKATANTYFEALVDLRKTLEVKGLRPKCFGACRDIYPSPMILDMGTGEKAYQLKMGCDALLKDLLLIFDSSPECVPVSVGEQEAFYLEWLKSLKANKS